MNRNRKRQDYSENFLMILMNKESLLIMKRTLLNSVTIGDRQPRLGDSSS